MVLVHLLVSSSVCGKATCVMSFDSTSGCLNTPVFYAGYQNETNRSLKNCSLKVSLGNHKRFFYGIIAPFWGLYF